MPPRVRRNNKVDTRSPTAAAGRNAQRAGQRRTRAQRRAAAAENTQATRIQAADARDNPRPTRRLSNFNYANQVAGLNKSRATVATNQALGRGPKRAPINRDTGESVSPAKAAAQRSRARALGLSYNQGQASRQAQRIVSTGNMPDGSKASRKQRNIATTLVKNSPRTR